MHGHPRFGLAATLALALSVVSTGCDIEEAGVETVVAESFAEGTAKDSDQGAFRVMLTSDDGLEVGESTLIVRLGFHDPHDPLAPGRGIPSADVMLHAWMPHDDGVVDGVRGVHVGDGRYEIPLDLPKAGVWQLDFDLTVGDGVEDSVSFTFVVGGESED